MKTGIKLLVLFLTISFFVMSVVPMEAAATSKYKVSFLGGAAGEAVILPNWIPGDTPAQEVIIGKGIMLVDGSAVADGPIPPNENIPYTFYYNETGIKAIGRIFASWSGHMIDVFLYSKGEAEIGRAHV